MVLARNAETDQHICTSLPSLPVAKVFDFATCRVVTTFGTSNWDEISMDFVEGLPKSHGVDTVLVVVDRPTKFGHFLSLKHPFTAATIANLFINEIVRLHGFPISIVTDCDRIFMTIFWRELFRLQGTSLKKSTTYHPQSDDETEMVKKTLETYLRCFIQGKPTTWAQWLPWAEFWYNTSIHSSTKCMPFRALYGWDPPSIIRHSAGSTQVLSLEESLIERDAILSICCVLNKS